MRQLPPLRVPVPDPGAENRQDRPHLSGKRQLDRERRFRRSTARRVAGGVLLSSMGNPKPYPVYWDKILINASQVTNPSIDPLREPMETRVFLGQEARLPSNGTRKGNLIDNLPPHLELRRTSDVLRHVLWLYQLQCSRESWRARRRNWEFSIIPVRAACMRIFMHYGQPYHCSGGLRAIRRAQGLSGGRSSY